MMEQIIRFLPPDFTLLLYFLTALTLMLAFVFFPYRKKRRFGFELEYWEKKIKLQSKKTLIIPILIVIVSLLIALTLSNPYIIIERSLPSSSGKPVMVVIDVSGSMISSYSYLGREEFLGFEKAKEIFYDLPERNLGTSLGLAIYSSQSYIARDFASKPELFKDTLENDQEIRYISAGTDTAKALAQARIFFGKIVPTKDKTIILLTDLVDNYPDLMAQEIDNISKAGIKLYIIVIQREPEIAQNRIYFFKETIKTEEEMVKMVWVGDEAGIEKIYQEIEAMESSLIEERKTLFRVNLTPYLLPLILGLVILSLVLSETRFRKIP